MKACRTLSRLALTASAFFVPALVVAGAAPGHWFPDSQSAIDWTAGHYAVSRQQAAGMIIMDRLSEMDRRRQEEADWLRYRARSAPVDHRAPAPAVQSSMPYVPPAPPPPMSPPATPSQGGTIKRGNVVIVVPPSAPGEIAVGVKKVLP